MYTSGHKNLQTHFHAGANCRFMVPASLSMHLRVVLESSEREVVEVQPDGGPPIRRIVLCVVLVVQGARPEGQQVCIA